MHRCTFVHVKLSINSRYMFECWHSSRSVKMVFVGVTFRPIPMVLKLNGCLKKPELLKMQEQFSEKKAPLMIRE